LPCCTTWLDTAVRYYFAWHVADNLQDLDRQPLFENIFQSHSSVDHTCKDCWCRVMTLCDPKQSSLCVCMEKARCNPKFSRLDAISSVSESSLYVCMEKAQCNPKCFRVIALCLHGKARCNPKFFEVITLCLHGKGLMQFQVF